jgi:GntR family transcriptional regulator
MIAATPAAPASAANVPFRRRRRRARLCASSIRASSASGFRRSPEAGGRGGAMMPAARDLAAVLRVDTNTVLRALRQLRDEGLLEFRRGRGITVTGTPEHGAVVEHVRELLRFARKQGYKPDEVVQIIQQLG